MTERYAFSHNPGANSPEDEYGIGVKHAPSRKTRERNAAELRRRKEEKAVKFYHVSPRRIHYGTMLTPGEGSWEQGYGVYATTSPVPHYTMREEVEKSKKPWHVYEIEPQGRVEYGSFWNDLILEQARVIGYIGNAQLIMRHAIKTFVAKDNFNNGVKGLQIVQPNFRAHGVKIRGRGSFRRALQMHDMPLI